MQLFFAQSPSLHLVTQNPSYSFTPAQSESWQRPLQTLQQYNSPALCSSHQLPSQLEFQSLTFCLPPDCEQWAHFTVMLLHVPASSPLLFLLPYMILFSCLSTSYHPLQFSLDSFIPCTLSGTQASHLTSPRMRQLVPVCCCFAFILGMLDDKYNYLF